MFCEFLQKRKFEVENNPNSKISQAAYDALLAEYQKDKQDYNSCGRWCVARLICKDMSNLQFHNLIKEQMKEQGLKEPDEWVSLFTYTFLGK